VGAMANRLTASLRESPATVAMAVALVLFFIWATDQAGYPLTHWAPGGLIVLGLLGVVAAVVGVRAREIPVLVRIALCSLAGYAALSYLSILWAQVPGDAWEGANRTLLYLLVFALFACWRQRGETAALLLCGWTLAMIGLAVFALLHLDGAGARHLASLVPSGRLLYPSGYPNANAAQWLMAFWPALLLARGGRLPWGLRGLLAGGAVLLGEVALLSQSRGSLYATAVMLVLVFALLPGRLRTFAVLVPVVLAMAAAAPAVLTVGERVKEGATATGAMHSATVAVLLASALAGAAVAAGAAVESRHAFSRGTATRIRRAVGVLALASLLAIVVGGLAAAGDPVARIRHGWDTFKAGYGADNPNGSRLVSGLGSNRYDFYRVALDEFTAHPILGIGADNFQQQYLVHGRSTETPHYPHSVELRALSQAGLLGTTLALIGLAAALAAAWRAVRPPPRDGSDPLAPAVAAAALGGFAYWLVHGSVDWFWEFAGLGAPAFAMLGLACALGSPAAAAGRTARRPGRTSPGDDRSRGHPPAPAAAWRRGRILAAGALVIAGLAAVASLAAPWLSQLQIERAAHVWPSHPLQAYDRLDQAARLNPLSDAAYLVAGSIAVRFGDLARADHEFALALKRDPNDAYATLERGAIASQRGDAAKALPLLTRAVELNPREPITRYVLRLARSGHRVSVQELNRSILSKAQQLA
jgi:tetratricopeptide (TPR) repeat protein